eukprot:gene1314-32667_t
MIFRKIAELLGGPGSAYLDFGSHTPRPEGTEVDPTDRRWPASVVQAFTLELPLAPALPMHQITIPVIDEGQVGAGAGGQGSSRVPRPGPQAT